MITTRVQTHMGELPLVSRADPLSSSSPLVLVIRGAFAPDNQMGALADVLSGVDVVFGEIPGHRTPRLISQNIGVYAAAYTEALQQIGRRAVICGVSLGGLVALAVRSPWVASVLALDPPLLTTDAPHLLRGLTSHDAPDFLWRVFGIGEGRCEPRDYRPALHGLKTPVTIFAGGQAPRPDQRLAGVISDDTFRQISGLPNVKATRFPACGHDLGYGATDAIVSELRRLLTTAVSVD